MSNVATSLSLMRRLPPNKVEQNVNALLNLLPDDQDELLQRIDQALEVETDTDTGKSFICCDYNRDGDSHRSPWSNKYFPPLSDAFGPSEKLRAMEVDFNLLFDNYRYVYHRFFLITTIVSVVNILIQPLFCTSSSSYLKSWTHLSLLLTIIFQHNHNHPLQRAVLRRRHLHEQRVSVGSGWRLRCMLPHQENGR